jgi:hypothetical protein
LQGGTKRIGLIHVRIKVGEYTIEEFKIFFIFGSLLQTGAVNLAQESNWVVTKPIP